MTDSQDKNKQALLEAAATTKQTASGLIKQGRDLLEAGQTALDWANDMDGYVQAAPIEFYQSPGFAHMMSGIHEFNHVAQSQTLTIPSTQLLSVIQATATTTSVTAVSALGDGSPQRGFGPVVVYPYRRPHRADEVKRLLQAFQLDKQKGEIRSALDLLCSAEDILKRPSTDAGYASAVLIPLRDAIDVAIDDLLKRRAFSQKLAGGRIGKVIAIAQSLGLDTLSGSHIDRVSTTADTVSNQLSSSKTRVMEREQIALLFAQGVSVLNDILRLVDPSKLRPVA